MTKPVESIGALYRVQLRTWAGIANFALRRASQCNDASIEAARQAIEANVKQCEALLAGDGASRWPAGLAGDGSSAAAMVSQWQGQWLEMATQTQTDLINLMDQLVADWSALTRGVAEADPVATGPSPLALGPIGQLYESMLRSWTTAVGAGAASTGEGEAPKGSGKRGRASDRSR